MKKRKVKTMVERERGCGWRRIGGLYLCGTGIALPCLKMPYELHVCPVCGEGVKFSRGFRWVDAKRLTGGKCASPQPYCTVCPFELEKAGLMFVGEKHYKHPSDFIQEAVEMGISKRVNAIPKELRFNEDYILLAHKKGMEKRITQEAVGLVTTIEKTIIVPAIFYAFKPTHAEKVVTQEMLDSMHEEEKKSAEERGIRFVVVPDEPKHRKVEKEAPITQEQPIAEETVNRQLTPKEEVAVGHGGSTFLFGKVMEQKPKKVRKLKWKLFRGHK